MIEKAMRQKTSINEEPETMNRSGTPTGSFGVEARLGSRHTSDQSEQSKMIERCVERVNMLKAWQRVKANKGAPGIDGMTIEDTETYLKKHWPRTRGELITGRYQPKAVREVEIPKPDSGVRKLGIPTVVDRLIQQNILQILQPEWDSTFHNNSYGFSTG